MSTLRLSLASPLSLIVSSLVVFGCSADRDATSSVASQSESLGSLALGQVKPISPMKPIAAKTLPSDIQIVAPACRAILVSTGPAVRPEPNNFGCASANPYQAQRRLAGNLESGLTQLLDDAQPGQLRCTPSKVVGARPVCSKATDRLVEPLCTETRVYECPCGVETVTVEGELAGQCRRFPK